MVSLCLFGIMACQAHTYFRRFPDDPRWTKALVTMICSCELVNAASVATAIYTLTIKDFGQPEKLLANQPGVLLSFIVGGIVGPAVQSLIFAYRIRKASGNLRIALGCWALSAVRFSGCLAGTVGGFRAVNTVTFIAQWRALFIALLAISTSIDVTVAVSLCYYFRSERGRAMRRTAKVLDRLIILTIHTGLLTSVTTVLVLVTCLAMPNNCKRFGLSLDKNIDGAPRSDIWLGVWQVLARLFAISLLASLNGRTPGRPETVCLRRAYCYACSTALKIGPAIAIEVQKTTTMATEDGGPYALDTRIEQADSELGR
ncbi:hypothetical protein PLICRDRAFT_443804 [Plicaturopsis crispa FD-325 SS-3]|uniref:DUF6534 domain-containing protein n=1 Tax=Plicaturopsis crispa FD-325 SS-3 TaxID=944288 RepID=A0A0C9SWP8_PLICR|nr:hypothetical protein PLICRDRAFT_443804 [Plicaturopsis crispa FD-325 SS-3]